MNAPERVLKTLNHEEPDRVPTFESTFSNNTIARHYGISPGNLGTLMKLLTILPFRHKVMKKTLESRKSLAIGMRATGKLYKNVGIDVCPSITAMFPQKILRGGAYIDEFGRHMHFEYAADGTEVVGYVGGSFQNFETYESWEQPDPAWPARLNGFLAGRDIQQELDNRVFFIPSTTGLLEVTWEGFGINQFARLLTKTKQAQKVFDDRGKFALEMVKILAERDARTILIFDDWGHKNGVFIRPQQFRQYIFPWLRQICDAAHKHDCKILLHSDGDLTEVMNDLVNCGVDALNPIEPTTANPNYNIFKVKQDFGKRLTLVGNISPVLLAVGEISEIEIYTKRLIRECAPGGGYIFASGHSINPAITLDRFEAMQRIRKQYGQYPISVPN